MVALPISCAREKYIRIFPENSKKVFGKKNFWTRFPDTAPFRHGLPYEGKKEVPSG
jgi:hypothetical protein